MYHSLFYWHTENPRGHRALIVLDPPHANNLIHLETPVFQTLVINIHGSTYIDLCKSEDHRVKNSQ